MEEHHKEGHGESHSAHHGHPEHAHHSPSDGGMKINANTLSFALIIIVALVLAYNQMMIFGISSAFSSASAAISTGGNVPSGAIPSSSSSQPISTGGKLSTDQLIAQLIPRGTPAYGSEMGGVSFDTPVQSIPLMSKYDTGITLAGEKLQRYITITQQISCEYCCGAASITFANGQAACGCEHSAAMRGLAKYLVDKYSSSQYSDDAILEELAKWKMIYFPRDMITKAQVMQEKGIALTYTNLGSNKYRGIEKGAPVSASGQGTLPQQVGGC